MTNPEDVAGRGVHLAGDMIRALADEDGPEMLRLVNTADHVEIRWASVALLQYFGSAIHAAFVDPVKARAFMRDEATAAIHEDAVIATVTVLVANSEEADHG